MSRLYTVPLCQWWRLNIGYKVKWDNQTHRYLHRDLHSYLLGEQEDNDANQPVNNNNNNNPPPAQHNNNNPVPPVGEGLHAAHQAILQQGGPVGFQPYHRPLRFPLRVRKPRVADFLGQCAVLLLHGSGLLFLDTWIPVCTITVHIFKTIRIYWFTLRHQMCKLKYMSSQLTYASDRPKKLTKCISVIALCKIEAVGFCLNKKSLGPPSNYGFLHKFRNVPVL